MFALAGAPPLSGALKVVTNRMKAGYLRRNGVPYSANAVLTEFFDRTAEPNGDSWLVLTSIVEDPTYLNQPFMLTTHFKREADGSKFSPTVPPHCSRMRRQIRGVVARLCPPGHSS